MIAGTVAEYSNFRYYSELLGADVLSAEMSNGLQDFRENMQGTRMSGSSSSACR